MPEGAVKYESRSVRTVRGLEARTMVKWKKLGWEFVSQNQLSMLRTEMTFRRVKKKLPKYVLPLAIGVPVIAFGALIILGVATDAWHVHSSADPVAAAANTSKATVSSPTPTATPPTTPEAAVAPAPVPTNQTASGLQWLWAWTTCGTYGKQQFPYGYADSVGDIYTKQIQGDTWWLKYQATVTNAYGAKRNIDVECTVGGSNDAPMVVDFISY